MGISFPQSNRLEYIPGRTDKHHDHTVRALSSRACMADGRGNRYRGNRDHMCRSSVWCRGPWCRCREQSIRVRPRKGFQSNRTLPSMDRHSRMFHSHRSHANCNPSPSTPFGHTKDQSNRGGTRIWCLNRRISWDPGIQPHIRWSFHTPLRNILRRTHTNQTHSLHVRGSRKDTSCCCQVFPEDVQRQVRLFVP